MDEDELRERLRLILDEEDQPRPDWDAIDRLCLELDRDLMGEPDIVCADSVYHYLNDADIRRGDERYGHWQRGLVRAFVETGEMTEHAPSIQLPGWGCALIVVAMAALVIWLLT